MDNNYYQKRFEAALAILQGAPGGDADLRFFAGLMLGAIAFKAYKDSWVGDRNLRRGLGSGLKNLATSGQM